MSKTKKLTFKSLYRVPQTISRFFKITEHLSKIESLKNWKKLEKEQWRTEQRCICIYILIFTNLSNDYPISKNPILKDLLGFIPISLKPKILNKKLLRMKPGTVELFVVSWSTIILILFEPKSQVTTNSIRSNSSRQSSSKRSQLNPKSTSKVPELLF